MGLAHRASEYGVFLSDQQLAVTTATTLTVPAAAKSAVITVHDNDINFRHGGAPNTSSTGHKVAVGSHVEIFGHTDLAALQVIARTGTANLHISYFGE